MNTQYFKKMYTGHQISNKPTSKNEFKVVSKSYTKVDKNYHQDKKDSVLKNKIKYRKKVIKSIRKKPIQLKINLTNKFN